MDMPRLSIRSWGSSFKGTLQSILQGPAWKREGGSRAAQVGVEASSGQPSPGCSATRRACPDPGLCPRLQPGASSLAVCGVRFLPRLRSRFSCHPASPLSRLVCPGPLGRPSTGQPWCAGHVRAPWWPCLPGTWAFQKCLWGACTRAARPLSPSAWHGEVRGV